MKNLDIFNTPLEGLNFIEASAGTGKTYTLEGLYIRLLLEKKLSPHQILVVTFTRAATAELKDRIRKKMVMLKESLRHAKCDDPFIDQLVSRIQNTGRAIDRIQGALVDFDRAAIYTIHGFCQRILKENAFETDNIFDVDLSADSSELYQSISDDFWRIHFYDVPPEMAAHARSQKITGPDYFSSMLKRLHNPHMRVVPDLNRPTLDSLEAYRMKFSTLQRAWEK